MSLTHADRQSRESSVRKTSALHWKVPVPSRSSSQLFRLGEMSFTQMAWKVEERVKVKEWSDLSSFTGKVKTELVYVCLHLSK